MDTIGLLAKALISIFFLEIFGIFDSLLLIYIDNGFTMLKTLQIFALLMFALPLETLAYGAIGARISFVSKVHNFGEVYRGQKLTKKFLFKNSGDQPLKIIGVHASCGCTVAKFEQSKEYAPKEEGAIEVLFDISRFSGKVSKSISVLTNSSRASNRTLRVKAFIKEEFKVNPPVLDFGEVLFGSKVKKSVKFNPFRNFPLELLGVLDHKDFLLVDFKKGKKSEWEVSVTLNGLKEVGFIKENLIIRTNSQHLPEVLLPVRGSVRGVLFASPEYIEFGAIKKDSNVSRKVKLKSRKLFNIIDVDLKMMGQGKEIPDPARFVSVEYDNSKLSLDKELKMVIKNSETHFGSVHGHVIIRTNLEHQKKIKLKFYAFLN